MDKRLLMILGIGTRRGITREEVLEAVKQALDECGLSLQEITAFASAKLKENERGLLEAGEFLGIPVNFLPDEVLNSYNPPSSSQASRFGLKGVAEPAALALSEKHELICRKKVYGRVTIAIAR
ncbi:MULTISPECIES: cobalamin biosynthesis protein [Methanosarcina]|uniref:Cobalamin biosynthesis protein G n=7 Tax=Methanosarcina mazei TaxID=2209 RepID=Q8PY68_METMA|nr:MULTISPECIES: cobalamin biosynthesis protein [Methanosarcina]AAM30692.1 cobalamin biosynthesis protein G [Methanosarcina mazei Go1]MDO5839240.1 cobalamin biosynthesis protein [Methanosarcina mazei]MDY0245667.1 cobalamin biosynthesis protein [Methanosarcina mazei]